MTKILPHFKMNTYQDLILNPGHPFKFQEVTVDGRAALKIDNLMTVAKGDPEIVSRVKSPGINAARQSLIIGTGGQSITPASAPANGGSVSTLLKLRLWTTEPDAQMDTFGLFGEQIHTLAFNKILNAAQLKARLEDWFKSLRQSSAMVPSVSIASNKITLTSREDTLMFSIVAEHGDNPALVVPDMEFFNKTATELAAVTGLTEGTKGRWTPQFIRESIRLQTDANVRPYTDGKVSAQMPIGDQAYTRYTIEHQQGLWKSVHVIYVHPDALTEVQAGQTATTEALLKKYVLDDDTTD